MLQLFEWESWKGFLTGKTVAYWPNWNEYAALYPERFRDGKAICQCGGSDIKLVIAPVNFGPVFNVCKSCNAALFTNGIYEKPIGGGVDE